jgi:hypothetical protein
VVIVGEVVNGDGQLSLNCVVGECDVRCVDENVSPYGEDRAGEESISAGLVV